MTKDTLPSKGRYGVYEPYALLLTDVIIFNIIILVVMRLNGTIAADTHRMLIVLTNVAYLPAAWLSLKLRRKRTLSMDRLVSVSLMTVITQALIFFALVAFLKISSIGLVFYAELYGTLLVMLPVNWVLARLALKWLRRRGRNYVNVVIIGYGEPAMRLAKQLQRDPGYGYKIHGFFSNVQPQHYGAGRYLGDINTDLPSYLIANNINEIYYTIDGMGDNEELMSTVVRLADEHMASFYYLPGLSRSVARSFHLTNLGSIPVLAAHHNPLDRPANRFVKRLFDIVFSFTFLLVSPVIFIPIAIAIKLSSPGPIFFKQLRTGYKGHEFVCYKFRTMRVNNEADETQATADDPRKTRVGDFLRRTSLDELPQFYNVLKGDMSVVGPRPHMVKHTSDYSRLIDKYMLRHVVKPGITGWAQILGYRGATNELWQMEGRVEMDVWYIENWNLLLDIKIIIRTITNAISGEENAY